MAKKLKIILAAFLAAVTIGGYSIVSTKPAYADEAAPIHLQVSPVKQKVSIVPGSKYTGSFRVQNVGTEGFNYTVYATPYSVTNDNYDADYVATSNYTQIANWITFDRDAGYLKAGETHEVTYYVDVPENAPAGGQYAALMAQTDAGNSENATIAVVHRVGMLLYASVPGTTVETGEIIKNSVNSFYFNPPVTFSSLVKNTGNVHQMSKTTVNVWPLFSKETIFSNQEAPSELDVLPETSRFNSITWNNAPSLGIFWVQQKIEFAGQVSNVEKFMLICPLWLLFVIFALLFFIIFWLVSRSRDRKRKARAAAGEVRAPRRESTSERSEARSDKASKQ